MLDKSSKCYQGHQEELNKEYSFNFGNGYELWAIIQRQELSSDLLQVITEWAVNRDKNHFMWGAESSL